MTELWSFAQVAVPIAILFTLWAACICACFPIDDDVAAEPDPRLSGQAAP